MLSLKNRLETILRLPEDTDEVLDTKLQLVGFSLSILPPIALLTLLCHLWNMPVLRTYGLALVIYYSISMLFFFSVKRHLAWFFYAGQLMSILITMATVARLGGILHSGGLLFAALASVVFAMVYPSIRLAQITFAAYALSVIALALAQPYLEIAEEITRPGIDLLFTAINSIWISIFILTVISYVFKERAKTEEAKTKRLRELEGLKNRLYTNITHEFRTPLTIILGASNLQASNSSLPIAGKGGKLDLIHRNANRLLRLVNQMLNLARLESGAMPVHFLHGDVLPLIQYLVDSSQSLAERKGVKLHCLLPNHPILMDHDPDKVEDMLINLLSNAVKFTPQGGDVYLSVEASRLQEGHQSLIVKVRDTGIGIPADQLSFIFDRFFQINNDSAYTDEGSGIGLTLVKEYAKLLHGEIRVESTLQKGTEFVLTLPITQEAKTPSPIVKFPQVADCDQEVDVSLADTDMEEHENGLPHLLLVEDNADLRHYLLSIISPHYQVTTASHGLEGIEKAIEAIPDIIISDVMMPVKDGYDLCKTLKEDFRTNHIPIILLTARADMESKLKGFDKGADAYISKPFQPKELLLRLRKLIELREKLRIKYRLGINSNTHSATPEHSLDELFLNDIQGALEKNYGNEDFGIEALCAKLGISRVQLHRKLIALSGKSASHYINAFRLKKATELLGTTRKTVAEIAFEIGFKDANYFSRVFSKTYGTSPGEWRNLKAHEKA